MKIYNSLEDLKTANEGRWEDPKKQKERGARQALELTRSVFPEVRELGRDAMHQHAGGEKLEALGMGTPAMGGMIRGPKEAAQRTRQLMREEFRARGKPENWFDRVFGGVFFRGEGSGIKTPHGERMKVIGDPYIIGEPAGKSLTTSQHIATDFQEAKRINKIISPPLDQRFIEKQLEKMSGEDWRHLKSFQRLRENHRTFLEEERSLLDRQLKSLSLQDDREINSQVQAVFSKNIEMEKTIEGLKEKLKGKVPDDFFDKLDRLESVQQRVQGWGAENAAIVDKMTIPVHRTMPLLGDRPSNVLVKGWKGSEHEGLMKEVYAEAIETYLKKSPNRITTAQTLGEDYWRALDKDEIGELMRQGFQRRGFKGIAYSAQRHGEHELRMFDPNDVISVDHRTLGDKGLNRYFKNTGEGQGPGTKRNWEYEMNTPPRDEAHLRHIWSSDSTVNDRVKKVLTGE